MSLASPYQEHYYVADGVTTSFSFGEYFTGLSQAYVKCIIYFDDGTNCVPTFTVDMTTGFITIVTLTKPDGTVLTVPPAGSIVRVFRDTPEQQNVTASQLQNYTAKQLERIFDSVVAMIQEVSYSDLHKTIRLTETQRDVSVEQLTEEKDQGILYWDFESRTIKATDYGQDEVVKSETVDRLLYLQPEGKIYFIPKGSTTPISIGSVSLHNDLGGRNAPNCHPESAITGLREHLQELRDKDIEIEEDVQIALNRSQEAKDTADEAKETAEYAQAVAEEAKDIAEDAKDIAEGIEDIAQEAKDTADEAKEIAQDAKDIAEGVVEDIEAVEEGLANHIADKANPHEVTKAQVGLGNVDNTSDLDKPISTATQTALDTKADETNLINGAPLSNTSSKFFGVSSTAAATVQKEVSIPSITSLEAGIVIIVQPTITSTVANSTLKLNSFDAYPMRYNNAAITTSTDSVVWSASFPSIWVFDGTYWVFAGHGLDSNTTYTLNYSVDAGQYTAGSGTYAVTRYSILAQKADGTWEKITATNANYSTGTSKSVNTSGFILNQLRYYGTTTTVASGVKIATNVLYEKAASVDMRYSTNCGGTTTWALGDYIYLVGTIGADGLFYLDTTTWWSNALPTTNDGKLYIRLGLSLTAAGYTMSFFDDRPIFYHDGTGIKEYKVADNKQDVISDLATIRSGASAGATAVQPGDLATVATSGSYNDLSDKPTIPAAQVNSDWNANSGVAQILNKPTLATVATSGSYNDLSNKPTIPTVGNGTITITQGGISKGTFTTNQSGDTTIALDAGGGGIGNIDNLTITENASQEIQAVAVIDQNTGIAKTWTGTMAEYDAIVTKDPETEYIITDDIGGSATEIGQITEALNDKVDKGHQVIEFQEPTAANNYTWYRKYADGWVEQGQYTTTTSGQITQFNYPVAMSDSNYTLQITPAYFNSGSGATVNVVTKTETGFSAWGNQTGQGGYWAVPCGWQVSGMAA